MKFWLVVLVLLLPLQSWAAIDTYEFKDEASRERFQQLTDELRCPKCQNQNLADSNSPIAKDLRTEIHRMLGEEQSDDQIIDFMVARYGEFVLYKPRKTASTWVLWYGPFVLLAFGLLIIVLISRRKRKPDASGTPANKPAEEPAEGSGLNETEAKRLNAILKQDDDQ